MKKFTKLLSIFLALAVIMSIVSVTALAAAGKVKTSTAGSSVTLREKPSTTAKSLGTVKDGTTVDVSAKSGNFYKVTVSGKTGYISKDYIVLSSSSSSSTSTTSTSSSTSSTTGTPTKGKAHTATVVYEKAATTSKQLVKVPKNAEFTISQSTTSFYKVTYSGKTGYVLKKYVTVTATKAATTPTTTKKDTSKPGDALGVYTSSSIPKPPATVKTKQELWNAISYNLVNFKDTFAIKIQNYDFSMLPEKTSNLEYAFTDGAIELAEKDGFKDLGNGITQLTFVVKYNEAGRILQSLKNKTTLKTSDTKAVALKKIVDKVLASSGVKGKSAYEKIVAIHDYIVLNVAYDEKMSAASYSAYGALVGGKGSCQGYAEANALLLSAAGIENRLVWANSMMGKSEKAATHGFNKVKLDGSWYNVDCTVDDPDPDVKGRLKRDFLLVTDAVSKQRYSWDYTRYPASNVDNNWHKRNNLVAKSQADLEKLVKAAVAKKQTQISVWVPDYTTSKYSAGFVTKLSGVKSASVKSTPAQDSYKTKGWGTAIFFTVSY